MQRKGQIQAPGHRYLELPNRLHMSIQPIQICLDMRTPYSKAGIRDLLPIFLIVFADVLNQIMEFLL